jgi:phage recombination protein Bet
MPRTKGSKNKPKGEAVQTTEMTIAEPSKPQIKSVINDMANRFHMEASAFEAALRATVVPKDCSPAQFAAFLMVAKEYNLNPLTKEIYAFPSRGGGIVPIVSVDGWVNLVNAQGQCDGFSFEMEHDGEKLVSCTCSMYRKDRKHPVVVTEYYAECFRQTEPWKMKHRMLRHKSLIQAARYAFGFSGIYDEDEGEKIAAIDPNRDVGPPRQITVLPSEQKQIEATKNPEPEQAHDNTPPPREQKPDPISSGPPRTAPKATPTPAAKAGNKPPEPFRIPGAGHSYETWANQYIDLINTSPDIATVYGWIDKNSKPFKEHDHSPEQAGPLIRLEKGKSSVYATIHKVTENVMQRLRDAQKKAEDKAAKAAPPSEMDDKGAPSLGVGGDPEEILAAIERELAAVEDADNLEDCWNKVCEPLVSKLQFPPDTDLAQAIYDKHSRRLGGD